MYGGNPFDATRNIVRMSDTAFAHFDTAYVHLQRSHAPLAGDLVWHQQSMDVAFDYSISSAQSRFKVDFELDRLGLDVITVLRFLLPGGKERAYQLHGSAGVVELDPSFWGAAIRFFSSGFGHILSGLDHVLFLACLVLATRSLYPILMMATIFAIGHSVTLIAAVFGIVPSGLWFAPWVESAIAASVFYMALENVLRPQSQSKARGRWPLCAAFGLIHGFGFSFALKESLQFAGDHLILSLLSFNLGVEAGQIVLLLAGVTLLRVLLGPSPNRIGALVLSALIAHTAWHWTITRGELAFKFIPTLDLETVVRWFGSTPAAGWLCLLGLAIATLAWASKSLKSARQTSQN
jgi:HupE / UreJ protein